MTSLLEIDYDTWNAHILDKFNRIKREITDGEINISTAVTQFKDLILQLNTEIKLSDLDNHDKIKFASLTLLIKLCINHISR